MGNEQVNKNNQKENQDIEFNPQSLKEQFLEAMEKGPAALDNFTAKVTAKYQEQKLRAETAEKFNIYDNFFASDEILRDRVLNHQGIKIEFTRQLDLIKRKGKFTILALDLDNFKTVNDTLGHLAGDEAIRTTANILNEHLRKTDFIGHPGGDEFLIGLIDTDEKGADEIATRIIKALPKIAHLSISIGIYQTQENDNLQSVREKADTALYQAKNQGKNQLIIF